MINTKSTNPVLKDLLRDLEEKGRKESAEIWKEVAGYLKSGGKRAEVNLSKIDRNSGEEDFILVPGKVLGAGSLTKEVKVAAFDFTKSARDSIEEEGETLSIKQLMEQKPSGEGVKILR